MYICICKSENKEGRRSKKRREKEGTNETEKAKE